MLDIMRKHASSWLIKLILGAIIISFVFFFGYSSYRKGVRGSRVGAEGGVAAKVNDISISAAEYKFFFDRTFDRLKSQFQGAEIPDFARQIAESSTLQQLVGRELMLQQADALGIVIPDEELADIIRDGQAAQAGGEFDPIAYRHEFLPYFRQRYNMDYESFVRQDLRIGAFQKLFAGIDGSPPVGEAAGRKESLWTFEIVTLDPKAMVASGAFSSEADARLFANKLLETPTKDWQKLMGPAKLTSRKVGPLKISERTQLFDGKGTLEQHQAIFALTKESPVAKPVEIDDKIYVVKFVERGLSEKDATPLPPGAGFFEEWMGKLMAKAKVHNYMAEEQK